MLTGFGLGLGGDFSAAHAAGAAALLAASRREDFPPQFGKNCKRCSHEAMPIEAFRSAALASAPKATTAGDFANAAAAFRASVNPQPLRALREALEQIGAMSEAVVAVPPPPI